jgi:hypothetical protein
MRKLATVPVEGDGVNLGTRCSCINAAISCEGGSVNVPTPAIYNHLDGWVVIELHVNCPGDCVLNALCEGAREKEKRLESR